MAAAPGPVTQLLVAWTNGDRAALEELIPAISPELRRIAGLLPLAEVTISTSWP